MSVCHVSHVCDLLAPPKRLFPSKLLAWFHFKNCLRLREVKIVNISNTLQVQTLKTDMCLRNNFFLLLSPIKHLTTPHFYLVTLWRSLTPDWEPLLYIESLKDLKQRQQ